MVSQLNFSLFTFGLSLQNYVIFLYLKMKKMTQCFNTPILYLLLMVGLYHYCLGKSTASRTAALCIAQHV